MLMSVRKKLLTVLWRQDVITPLVHMSVIAVLDILETELFVKVH